MVCSLHFEMEDLKKSIAGKICLQTNAVLRRAKGNLHLKDSLVKQLLINHPGLYSWCAHSESSVNDKSNEQLESQITTVECNEKNVENEAKRKDIETQTDLIESKVACIQNDQSVVALVKQYKMRIEEL
ncbi:uncharacterized protein LOC111324548 [Stylophora pistillata]|uniref:uncharacterized protein LOC111324548 n=1 Tax=Stylophora pistillata TaxID=50429 RepID=UPI000C0448EF|nr:uncharacterized protein LOC111324548 [Stylophora pistillata]